MEENRFLKWSVTWGVAYILVGTAAGFYLGMYDHEPGYALVVSAVIGLVAGFHYFKSRMRYEDPKYWPGHCKGCGYDLTGNESGVCPECGTKMKSA